MLQLCFQVQQETFVSLLCLVLPFVTCLGVLKSSGSSLIEKCQMRLCMAFSSCCHFHGRLQSVQLPAVALNCDEQLWLLRSLMVSTSSLSSSSSSGPPPPPPLVSTSLILVLLVPALSSSSSASSSSSSSSLSLFPMFLTLCLIFFSLGLVVEVQLLLLCTFSVAVLCHSNRCTASPGASSSAAFRALQQCQVSRSSIVKQQLCIHEKEKENNICTGAWRCSVSNVMQMSII